MTTYDPEPPRRGMAPWAKWTLIGCSSCLVLTLIGAGLLGVAGWQLWQKVGKNMKFETIDVSTKPDPPPNATAAQLLPLKVDGFVRTRVTHPTSAGATGTNGWQGSYVSAGKHVELMVSPMRAGASGAPFGGGPPGGSAGRAVHMSVNTQRQPGARTMDMVVWSKTHWTFNVESPDMVAVPFTKAYVPAGGGSP